MVAFHALDYDLSLGGRGFRDPDGDPLTYELKWFGAAPAGLSLLGTRVQGATADVGEFNLAIVVRDGRGGELTYGIFITVEPNTAPAVIKPNPPLLVGAGGFIDYDANQSGTTFSADSQGDIVTYGARILSAPQGLAINGTRVTGSLNTAGAVRVEVTATDQFGASSRDEFLVAVQAPEPAGPSLPVVSYVYEDELLPLPTPFRQSSLGVIPLWDTTPANNRITNAGATLGRVLFYDKRLSLTNTHSCASCHEQSNGFANATRFSTGITGELSKRNAMGLTGARYNLRDAYFADVRTSTLERLALLPIEDHLELGNTLPLLVEKLRATDFYPALFSAAFGSTEINDVRIARALAQFLRSLISYSAKVDQVENPPAGQAAPEAASVYNAREFAGMEVFLNSRCFFCHNDTTRSTFDPTNNGLDVVGTDLGEGGGRFRTASLRNIARTAPYMHDGRFATLRDVVDHYDQGVMDSPNLDFLLRERGGPPRRLNLTEEEKVGLVAFLETFTDTQFLTDPKFADPFP